MAVTTCIQVCVHVLRACMYIRMAVTTDTLLYLHT